MYICTYDKFGNSPSGISEQYMNKRNNLMNEQKATVVLSIKDLAWLTGLVGEKLTVKYLKEKYCRMGFSIVQAYYGQWNKNEKSYWFAFEHEVYDSLIRHGIIRSEIRPKRVSKRTLYPMKLDWSNADVIVKIMRGRDFDSHKMKMLLEPNKEKLEDIGINYMALKEGIYGNRYRIGKHLINGKQMKLLNDEDQKELLRKCIILSEDKLIEKLHPPIDAYHRFKKLLKRISRSRGQFIPDFVVFTGDGDVHVYEVKSGSSRFTKKQKKLYAYLENKRDIEVYFIQASFKFPSTIRFSETKAPSSYNPFFT